MSQSDQADDLQAIFSDAEAVAQYAKGPPQFMPGYADMQLMAGILLAEHMPDNGEVLVVGAGGGREIKVFGQHYPNWTFVGVDPSVDMLALARQTLGDHAGRATLIEGYIKDAPDERFDGATCLLTLHFLDRDDRLKTLRHIRSRLKDGRPFVMAHTSFPVSSAERYKWLERYARFALSKGADPEIVATMREKVGAHLHILSPEDDEALLREAGFNNIEQFYHGFTWRGWVAYAG